MLSFKALHSSTTSSVWISISLQIFLIFCRSGDAATKYQMIVLEAEGVKGSRGVNALNFTPPKAWV